MYFYILDQIKNLVSLETIANVFVFGLMIKGVPESPMRACINSRKRIVRRGKKTLTPRENEFCMKALASLMKKKNKPFIWPFLYPVSKEEAPGYYNIIYKPMDLDTIRIKLEKQEYIEIQEFIDDLKQIAENCFRYNKKDSEIYLCGEMFEKVVLRLIAKEDDPNSRIVELRKEISELVSELVILERQYGLSEKEYGLSEREKIGRAILKLKGSQLEKISEIMSNCSDKTKIDLRTLSDLLVKKIVNYMRSLEEGYDDSTDTGSYETFL